MDIRETLEEIGLSDGEVAVYLALLKLGSVPVNKIKEETRLHRTTIYDFVEKLLNKGLVSYVVKGNVKFYKGANPSKLLDFVKEKEMHIREVLPHLSKLAEFKKEDIQVEVFKGVEGAKTIFNDILRVGRDYVVSGVDEQLFKEKFGSFMDQFFRQEKERGFTERILTRSDAPYIYPYSTTFYRYLQPELFSPTPTYVYGDRVAFLIWEPLTIIRVINPSLAESYAKHFEILWKIAKNQPAIRQAKK